MKETRSYSVKNKNFKASRRNLPHIHTNDVIQEENESINRIKDNIYNETDDVANEDESDFHSISNFQYYFELIISIIMSINSFFTYSYLNIIHLVFCFIFIYSRFNIEYNFFAKSRKTFMIIVLLLDVIYIIIKTILFILYAINSDLSEKIEFIYPFFIIGYQWRNYYDYVIVVLIILLISVYLIIAEFDEEFFKANIVVKTTNILLDESFKPNNVLNLGFFYISLGAAVFPSIIDLIILIIGFLFFISLILNKKCRNFMKRYLSILVMIIVPIYTIINYSLNSKQIMDIAYNKYIIYFFVDLFKKDDKENSEYRIGAGCFPFLFFMLGYNEINVYLKSFNIIRNKNKEILKKKIKAKKQHSFLSNYTNDEIIKNDSIFSDNKKKNNLQSIFNANIDCGILIFSKESSNVDIYTKIKMFLLKFCYTPAFCLHICRLCVILWINCYITYSSIILILWIFLSINFSSKEFFFIITKIIVYPLLIVNFIISYVSNIRGTFYSDEFFGLIYYDSATERILHMANKFVIITFFQMYIHLKAKHAKLLKIKEIREEIKIQQEELENVINHDLKGKYVTKPLEIFFKVYFLFLDFLLIIFFYLSITQTINIMNQIGLLFLISMFILNNKNFKNYGIYICLIIINISFLAKYIVHFFYPTMKNVNNITNTELVLSILFHDYLYNIHYYWIAYYLLFLEYISQTSQLFKICNSKTISMHEIIEFNLGAHNYIKFVLTTLTNFIFGIYIWLLIPFYVACLIMQDNNIIFLFQLLIIFFIYYKYIQITNNNYSNLDQISNIFKYTWTLIFSTTLNLLVIYVIQFSNKRPISAIYLSFNFKSKKFFEVIGLFIFNGGFHWHLLCFFCMFILSVALHVEIGRQIKLNTTNVAIKNKVKKYSLSDFRNKTHITSLFKSSKKVVVVVNDEQEDEFSIERKDKIKIKEPSNQRTLSNIYENKKNREKNLRKRRNEKQKATQMIYRLYIVLYYILHYYWIIIFIFISAISFHWMLSITMAVQLFLFCFYIGKSFIIYFNYYNKLSKNGDEVKSIKDKVNRHVKERRGRFKTTSETQQEYFRYLWFFTFAFIIISYLCSILLKIIKAYSVTYPDKPGIIKFYKIFSAFMYVLGFYSINEDDSTKKNFLPYSWGYFIIIGLFSIRAYLSNKFNEIKTIYFYRHTNKEKKEFRSPRLSKNIEGFKFNEIDFLSTNNDNNFDELEESFNSINDLNISIDNVDQARRFKFGMKKKKKKDKKNEGNKIKRKLSYDFIKTKIGKKERKEFLKEKKLFIYAKDDFNIPYKQTFKNKNIESSITIQSGVKKFFELLVVILITINTILKCNIISFVLIIILITTYSYESLTTRKMFKISFVLLILLVFQYLLFVTNINYYTNPFINNEVMIYILEIKRNKITGFLGYRWSTFFSLGTNRYQLYTLWLDVIIILVLYFYLEFFSYSIYIKENENEKIEKITTKYNKKFKELQTMNDNEYKSFVRAMKVSYNIELKTNSNISEKKKKSPVLHSYNRKLLEVFYYFGKDSRYLDMIKSDTLKGLMKLKSYFYLSFHYILLLLILLISLINQGLIVLGYMSFSIYYLYKSHCFLKGRRWTLLSGIHTFMKPYLFIDILFLFIFQIPLGVYNKNNLVLSDYFKIFGYVQIVDYSSREEFFDRGAFFYVLLKVLSYFLILVQENIYVSYDFKKFILQYHYEYLQKAFIKGKLYSFLFNNYRVQLMNDRLKQRKEINESLNNILCTITNWNKHLRGFNEGNNIVADLYEAIPSINQEKKKEVGITVGKIVRKHWLISLALQIFESSFTVDDDHYNVSGDILKILKGYTVLNSELDDLIDAFEKKNYQKYGDIKNIKSILEEKRKKKEEEEKEKKEKKNGKETKSSKRNSVFNSKELIKKRRQRHSSIASIDISVAKFDNEIEDEENISENVNSNKNIDISHSTTTKFPQEKMLRISYIPKTKNYYNNQLELRSSAFCIGEEISHFKESEGKGDLIEEESSALNNCKLIKNEQNESKFIKLDQPYDDMFFAHSDYRELKEEIRQDFFLHYCSKKKIILIIIKSIYNFFGENFEYTVYFFMILNHLIYGAASSLIFAFLVFILGIVQYPRPNKLFWKITLIYCTIIVFLKFVLQLNIWNNFENFQQIIDIKNNPTSFFAIIGIYKLNNYEFLDFFYYVIFDFLVLTSLIVNQFILIRKGLWYMTEINYETIEESNDRIIRFNTGKKAVQVGLHINSQKILGSNDIIRIIGKVLPPKKGNFKKIITAFYKKNFSHIRNEKPGKDFYLEYTLFQILILVYIILLYTKMEKDQEIYNVNILSLKQFSGHMAICAFIHIFLIVFDRFIYLKNTRKLKKIEFKVYDKHTGKDITINYKNSTYLEVLSNLNEKDYEIVSYQYEGCQTGLLMKFGMQIATVLGIHIFIFFYLPFYGVVDTSEELNTLSNNPFILLFYLLYIFYFVFSGLQIKYGLSDLRKMSVLMKSSNLFHSIYYKVFKNIPFLYELKNFIDWTFTTTSLDLWKWLKLEEIISLLYINKCFAKGNMKRRIGTKIPVYMKLLMGGSIFFGVLLIVFGPIFLFSSLNPTNKVRPVIGVNLKILLQIPPSEDDNQQVYELTLLDTYNSQINIFSSDSEYQKFIKDKERVDFLSYTSSFDYEQVQKVKIFGLSETNWDISPKLLEYFKDNVQKPLNISLKYSFTTQDDASSSSYYGNEIYEDIDYDIFEKISDLIFNESTVQTEVKIEMPNVYSPYQKLQSDSEPKILIKHKVGATLVLNKQKKGDKTYYNWNIYSSDDKSSNQDYGLEFITFSDFYSFFTFGMDVITFYVSFVVVVGNLLRAVFLGQSERIMYAEMVNPGKLFSVCEGIKISRIKKDFLKEEKLYYLLIDFMRSPEMFKNLTMSSLIYIQDNNIGREEIKYKEYEVESKALIASKKPKNKILNSIQK